MSDDAIDRLVKSSNKNGRSFFVTGEAPYHTPGTSEGEIHPPSEDRIIDRHHEVEVDDNSPHGSESSLDEEDLLMPLRHIQPLQPSMVTNVSANVGSKSNDNVGHSKSSPPPPSIRSSNRGSAPGGGRQGRRRCGTTVAAPSKTAATQAPIIAHAAPRSEREVEKSSAGVCDKENNPSFGIKGGRGDGSGGGGGVPRQIVRASSSRPGKVNDGADTSSVSPPNREKGENGGNFSLHGVVGMEAETRSAKVEQANETVTSSRSNRNINAAKVDVPVVSSSDTGKGSSEDGTSSPSVSDSSTDCSGVSVPSSDSGSAGASGAASSSRLLSDKPRPPPLLVSDRIHSSTSTCAYTLSTNGLSVRSTGQSTAVGGGHTAASTSGTSGTMGSSLSGSTIGSRSILLGMRLLTTGAVGSDGMASPTAVSDLISPLESEAGASSAFDFGVSRGDDGSLVSGRERRHGDGGGGSGGGGGGETSASGRGVGRVEREFVRDVRQREETERAIIGEALGCPLAGESVIFWDGKKEDDGRGNRCSGEGGDKTTNESAAPDGLCRAFNGERESNVVNAPPQALSSNPLPLQPGDIRVALNNIPPASAPVAVESREYGASAAGAVVDYYDDNHDHEVYDGIHRRGDVNHRRSISLVPQFPPPSPPPPPPEDEISPILQTPKFFVSVPRKCTTSLGYDGMYQEISAAAAAAADAVRGSIVPEVVITRTAKDFDVVSPLPLFTGSGGRKRIKSNDRVSFSQIRRNQLDRVNISSPFSSGESSSKTSPREKLEEKWADDVDRKDIEEINKAVMGKKEVDRPLSRQAFAATIGYGLDKDGRGKGKGRRGRRAGCRPGDACGGVLGMLNTLQISNAGVIAAGIADSLGNNAEDNDEDYTTLALSPPACQYRSPGGRYFANVAKENDNDEDDVRNSSLTSEDISVCIPSRLPARYLGDAVTGSGKKDEDLDEEENDEDGDDSYNPEEEDETSDEDFEPDRSDTDDKSGDDESESENDDVLYYDPEVDEKERLEGKIARMAAKSTTATAPTRTTPQSSRELGGTWSDLSTPYTLVRKSPINIPISLEGSCSRETDESTLRSSEETVTEVDESSFHGDGSANVAEGSPTSSINRSLVEVVAEAVEDDDGREAEADAEAVPIEYDFYSNDCRAFEALGDFKRPSIGCGNEAVLSDSLSEVYPQKCLASEKATASIDALTLCDVPEVRESPAQTYHEVHIHKNQSMQAEKLQRIQRQSNRDVVRKGKWTLGSQIGAGSFGVVHVGMNTLNGNLMAVKSIHVPATSSALTDDLRREIELMRNLRHANIVRYIGAEMDTARSILHIFQEWVPGGSVSSMLKKFGPFSLPVMRSYLRQILAGLEYLHSRGVLHRDIKGGNILVNNEGVVKLADFGASRRMRSFEMEMTEATCLGPKSPGGRTLRSACTKNKEDMMESLTMRGTPYFMAPEVFEERYGPKADIWSFGGVAFQMATGEAPWRGMGFSNPVTLFLYLKSHDDPPPLVLPVTGGGHFEKWKHLQEFICKCFHRDPTKRPSASCLLVDPLFDCEDSSNCESPSSRGSSNFSNCRFSLRRDWPRDRAHSASERELGQTQNSESKLEVIAGDDRSIFQPEVVADDWPTWAQKRHYGTLPNLLSSKDSTKDEKAFTPKDKSGSNIPRPRSSSSRGA